MNEIDEEFEESRQGEAEESGENAPGAEEEPKRNPFSDALEWVNSIVYAVAAMLALNLFFFRSITVDGTSMNDTLQDNDKVIATNFLYTPKHGDVVVIQADGLGRGNVYGEPIIKRVIAVEGDTISIDYLTGSVYLNGELLEEEYIKNSIYYYRMGWLESGKDYVVPKNCVFVMGDNREVSNDSRNLNAVGFIDTNLIMGKAFVRFSPIKSFKWL